MKAHLLFNLDDHVTSDHRGCPKLPGTDQQMAHTEHPDNNELVKLTQLADLSCPMCMDA